MLFLLMLLIPTIVFAQEYTKIDDQTFSKEVIVTINYEDVKNSCIQIREKEQELLGMVEKVNLKAIECEAQVEELEGLGAKSKLKEDVIVDL